MIGQERAMGPEEVISIQSSNVFNRSHAMWAITTLKLPDVDAFRHWMFNHSSDDTATDRSLVVRKDEDAGMGRVRMALVKMGCRVNLDAPNTVSSLSLVDAKLMVGMRDWGFDLSCTGRKQDT